MKIRIYITQCYWEPRSGHKRKKLPGRREGEINKNQKNKCPRAWHTQQDY